MTYIETPHHILMAQAKRKEQEVEARTNDELSCSVHIAPDIDCPYCFNTIWDLQNSDSQSEGDQ